MGNRIVTQPIPHLINNVINIKFKISYELIFLPDFLKSTLSDNFSICFYISIYSNNVFFSTFNSVNKLPEQYNSLKSRLLLISNSLI